VQKPTKGYRSSTIKSDSGRKRPNITILRALRQSQGLSLDDVALKGFNKFTLAHLEGGYQKASKKLMVSIEDIYAVRRQFLFDPYGYAITLSPKDVLMVAKHKRKKRNIK